VLIAGPNLTIDRTSALPELRPGEVLRFDRVVVTPGGKGLNVARTARSLGVRALLVGFVPGETGRAAAALIGREGVDLRGVPCAGEIRSTAIVMERGGRVTVMNEPGPPVAPADWDAFEAAVAAALPAHRVLVCSGSVPPGSPDDAYGRLAALARRAGRPSIVDGAGTTLAAALDAAPDVVCPNLAEAEAVLAPARERDHASPVLAGRDEAETARRAEDESAARDAAGRDEDETARRAEDESATRDAAGRDEDGAAGREPVDAPEDARPRALAAATELVERGARGALVTAASAGAALAIEGAAPVWLPAPRIASVRNPVGAGDVLVGALAAALERGAPLHEAARHGVATAAASVESPTAGDVDAARAAALLAAVVPA
jgi:fructose-1-phosphate kinase PfkB-like protein